MNGNANLATSALDDTSHLKLGFTYKDKNRDYRATRFYYNLNKLNPPSPTSTTPTASSTSRTLPTDKSWYSVWMQPKDSYRAGNEIYAGYLLTDFYPTVAPLGEPRPTLRNEQAMGGLRQRRRDKADRSNWRQRTTSSPP